MATYVTSDAHGHLRALDRALELAQPGAGDTLYVLGDMVDRGPDPVGVLKLVRSLDNARVLMGNHERMLLDTVGHGDAADTLTWHMNGGFVTAEQLDALPEETYRDLMDWIAGLPLFAVTAVDDLCASAHAGERRVHLLSHAGVDALALRGYLATAGYGGAVPDGGYTDVPLDVWSAAMASQDPEDLLWIRQEFWGEPTGLVGADGHGPVVIAGHTPSLLIGRYAGRMASRCIDEDDRALMVEVGACQDTGGVPDRLDIDCSAAVGWPHGRVGVMRLEDRRVWYADIEEGE